ncbi:MAG: hypothetical protein ACWGQW_12855, partial [bacterium]
MAKDDQSSDLDPRKGKASASEAHRIVACPGYLFAKENWEKIEEPQSAAAVGDRVVDDRGHAGVLDGDPRGRAIGDDVVHHDREAGVAQDETMIVASGDQVANDVTGVQILQEWYPTVPNMITMYVWNYPQISQAVKVGC